MSYILPPLIISTKEAWERQRVVVEESSLLVVACPDLPYSLVVVVVHQTSWVEGWEVVEQSYSEVAVVQIEDRVDRRQRVEEVVALYVASMAAAVVGNYYYSYHHHPYSSFPWGEEDHHQVRAG